MMLAAGVYPPVVVRDSDGVVLAATCWYRPTLPDSDIAESMAMLMGLALRKICCS